MGIRSFAGNADSYSALTCENHGDFFVTSKNWSIGRKNRIMRFVRQLGARASVCFSVYFLS